MCTTYGHTHRVLASANVFSPEFGFILKRYFSAAAFCIMVHYDSVMRKYFIKRAKRAPAGAARRGGEASCSRRSAAQAGVSCSRRSAKVGGAHARRPARRLHPPHPRRHFVSGFGPMLRKPASSVTRVGSGHAAAARDGFAAAPKAVGCAGSFVDPAELTMCARTSGALCERGARAEDEDRGDASCRGVHGTRSQGLDCRKSEEALGALAALPGRSGVARVRYVHAHGDYSGEGARERHRCRSCRAAKARR